MMSAYRSVEIDVVRLLLLTVFPAALIALFPVQAKLVLDRGVRLYSSGNRVLEMR